MIYKVGDKVRIKSLDWYNENKDKRGFVQFEHANFITEMSQYCGKVLTINQVVEEYKLYLVSECQYAWTYEMIEGLVEEKCDYVQVDNIPDVIQAKTSSACSHNGFYGYSDSDGNEISEWYLPEGYQFVDENGNVINATKIVLEKQKKEYPKTYEECCKVLGIDTLGHSADGYKWEILSTFQNLLICRDAYWKIAGDEMGLGKPWKPDWEDDYEEKYIIGSWLGTIQGLEENFVSHPFAFPTKEMRDAFYENFKELIEICKELL